MDKWNYVMILLGFFAVFFTLAFLAITYINHGRGLHSSTFQLNLSALYGIGVARRDCVAHVDGVLGGV